MSAENTIANRGRSAAPGPDAPLAIAVEGLHKSFRIPTQRVDSLKERAVHPFASREYRELHALDGISFDVRHRQLGFRAPRLHSHYQRNTEHGMRGFRQWIDTFAILEGEDKI